MMCLEVKMPLALLTSAYDSISDAERSCDITSQFVPNQWSCKWVNAWIPSMFFLAAACFNGYRDADRVELSLRQMSPHFHSAVKINFNRGHSLWWNWNQTLFVIPYYDMILSSLSQLWSMFVVSQRRHSWKNQTPCLRRGRRQRKSANEKIMFIFIAPLILTQ